MMARLTPRNWKERYNKYREEGGYISEEFELPDVDDMVVRLAEIEDAIESGNMVKLPCRVGDVVYLQLYGKVDINNNPLPPTTERLTVRSIRITGEPRPFNPCPEIKLEAGYGPYCCILSPDDFTIPKTPRQ